MAKLQLTRGIGVGAGVFVLAIGQLSAAQAAGSPGASIDRALVDKYCVTCHNDKVKAGSLILSKVDFNDVKTNDEILEKVVRKLRSHQMPPDGMPRPDQATIDAFASSLETALDKVAQMNPDPGRISAHRLNRAEYVNVVKDLLNLDVDGASLLPGDMSGFGFDNNADALTITPGLLTRYMAAATKVSRLALGSPDNRPMVQQYRVLPGTVQSLRMSEDEAFATHGGLAVRHTFPLDGEYVFRVRMKRNDVVSTIDGIEDISNIELRIDRGLVKRFTIGGEFKGPDPGVLIAPPDDDVEGQKVHKYHLSADNMLEIRVPVKAGTRIVSTAFTDSAPSPLSEGGHPVGDEVGIDTLEIQGPFNGKQPTDTPSREKILICKPKGAQDEEGCARKIITVLARRAFRRPVTAGDVDPLLKIYDQGRKARDFDGGVERAVEALLSSPDFLIRYEHAKADVPAGGIYRLTDLELASRLSFFLWRSIPDDELLTVADAGKLKDATTLSAQVRRMMADPRSRRFMNDFAEQWLQIRNLHTQDMDRQKFPDFDPSLRDAMAEETELFIDSQMREDHSIPELLTANYTFLNERLARHYGINDVYGNQFRRVALSDDRRGGLLGQASILMVSSYADRTSVVLRGKWVLDNILGTPPNPPPPNVPPLKENDGKSKPVSLRARMEEHRKNQPCLGCHGSMDPLGFVLEHYDATGKWRDTDQGLEINSAATWGGQNIDSPKAFRAVLMSRKDQFVRTVTEKLMTYALGRGVDPLDAPTIRQIDRDLAKNGDRWSALVFGIVQSPQFEMRRAPVSNTTTIAQK